MRTERDVWLVLGEEIGVICYLNQPDERRVSHQTEQSWTESISIRQQTLSDEWVSMHSRDEHIHITHKSIHILPPKQKCKNNVPNHIFPSLTPPGRFVFFSLLCLSLSPSLSAFTSISLVSLAARRDDWDVLLWRCGRHVAAVGAADTIVVEKLVFLLGYAQHRQWQCGSHAFD